MSSFISSAKYFPTDLQQVVYFERYSRYVPEKGRREHWEEGVDRAVEFLDELTRYQLTYQDYKDVKEAILKMEVLPSLRLLASAGDCARRDNACIFNCAYLTLSTITSLTEIAHLSMNGIGVGFSVERKHIEQFPRVEVNYTGDGLRTYVVEDTQAGWVDAFRVALECAFSGQEVHFDVSKVRPAGAPLKTKGGRASGPGPLIKSLTDIRKCVRMRAGTSLRSVDVCDIATFIAEASLSGGSRRSALIALFDCTDDDMLRYKEGAFWEQHPNRQYVNVSAITNTQEEQQAVLSISLRSDTGEPGVFNRQGIRDLRPARRKDAEFGTNPCVEITLRDMQFCNLSSIICRADDTEESLLRKARLATIIGTAQAMADYYPGLRPEWTANQQEERLLGVTLTASLDCPVAQDPAVQRRIRDYIIEVNAEYAAKWGICQAASCTAEKPAGNTSVLANCASGAHPRHAPYYLRRVELNTHSPVKALIEHAGIQFVPKSGTTAENTTTWIATFAVKSPPNAIVKGQRNAIQQLDYWLQMRVHYTEHHPSITISYRAEEVPAILEWCALHSKEIAGLSFLQEWGDLGTITYPNAPYETITQEEYEAFMASMPAIPFERLPEFERAKGDLTNSTHTSGCAGGVCDLAYA